jgi:putative salt-induced outer membrane protein YdiY
VWRSLLLFVCMCAASCAALADQVTLQNGDRLSGTIVKADGKTLLIKTEFAGDVTVQWGAITAIESTQKLYVALKNGETPAGTVKTADGKVAVAEGAKLVEAPKEEITAVRNETEETAYQRELHPRFVDLWSGLLDTGLSVTRGNSQTLTFNLSGKAARVTKRNKLSAYATAIYATDDTTPPERTIANARRGGIRDEFNVKERVFVFGFGDFESDAFQNLDLQSVFGGGFGYHVIKTANTQFDVSGGVSFNHQSFSAIPPAPPATVGTPGFTRDTAEAVLGETLNWKLNGRTTVTEALSVFPNVTDLGQYRFAFDGTAATKLNNWLSWQVTFSDRYLSDPIGSRKKNDSILSTGLRLTYGKGVF